MSAAVDLESRIGDEVNVPLKPLHGSGRTKTFKRTPLTVQTDRSNDKGMTVIGSIIYDVNSSKLVRQGNVNYELTSN